jgi:outer membrane protein insertion porin family
MSGGLNVLTHGYACWFLLFIFYFLFSPVRAQDVILNPDISYAGTPRSCEIGGISVKGVEGYEDFVLIGLSGLSVGQVINVPGTEITEAVKRYWKHGLFSNVSITADSIVNSKVYLCIHLSLRPRITGINYYGVKKSEREDLETKMGLIKDIQLTPNLLDRARIWGKKYFEDKGFKNVEISFQQTDDLSETGKVILDVNIDKKDKVKVYSITVDGNHSLTMKQIKG